jgi:nitrite reductase (NAD(P)H)
MAGEDPEPILTPGIEPTSGGSHSPPASYWDTMTAKGGNISSSDWNDAEANKLPEKVEELSLKGELPKPEEGRKRIVVVGLGMVGISFM